MDQSTQILALILLAAVGILAVVTILRRTRVAEEESTQESPFGVATEGMKRCPTCGFGNLVTDATCASCGSKLPG